MADPCAVLTRIKWACALALAALLLGGCHGDDWRHTPLSCAELAGATVPPAHIGLPSGGARVTSAELVAPAGSGAAALGEYCKVVGAIDPVDPNAPKILFQLDLPTDWNGKALMFGGGGYDGSIPAVAGNVPAGPTDRLVPLGRGYATFGSDSGHQANAFGSRDGSFGLSDEALANFASAALKKTRDAAHFLIRARYGVAPRLSYFAGGSSGGREALMVAQNWPEDFDGVIALYPAWNAASLDLQFGRITRALAQPGAYPGRAKRKLLYDAALAACDSLDGVSDGLISNVAACNAAFDPGSAMLNGQPLRCAGGADLGDSCLSDAQIVAFRTIATPLALAYALASGESGYPGFNAWGTDFGVPGSSPLQPTVLTLALGTEAPASPMPPVTASTSPPYMSTFWDQWVRYFVTRDPNADSLQLDPQNPGAWQARIVALTALQDVNSADFSAFGERGGKLLMAHGSADGLVSTRASEQFYARVRTAMGATRMDRFMRYYEIPGYGHAASSVFNAAWDSLGTLEDWVERNIAPPPQVVADSAGVPGRTRPLCVYPAWPRYRSGDVNAAASFDCVSP